MTRWHRHEIAGRQFRILVRAPQPPSTVFSVVKIDEAIGDDEVRLFAIPANLTGASEAEALERAVRLIGERIPT